MWGSTLTREQDGTPEVDTHALQASLDAAIGSRACWVKRARVLVETESTQEAAFEEAQRGGPGVLVTCLRQPGGRGRLGRTWADPGGKGVAATLAITWPTHDAGSLSLRAGLAACFAARACLASAAVDREGAPRVGLRWPNDVVERTSRGPGRKLAGVLIEQRAGVCLVGIGLNVLQGAQDWPVGLAGKAVSLHELGARVGVPEAARELVLSLELALSMSGADVLGAWHERDVLVGGEHRFECGGVRYRGRVLAVRPLEGIEILDETGTVVVLPAQTTSLVHEAPAAGGMRDQ